MATTSKALFRGAATTTLTTTLYTVPSLTTTVVSNIIVSNNSASSQTATIYLNGIPLVPTSSIAANSIAAFDIKQAVPAGQLIQGGASTTAVNFHISGVEIA
jgi:hypothetical protein